MDNNNLYTITTLHDKRASPATATLVVNTSYDLGIIMTIYDFKEAWWVSFNIFQTDSNLT